MKNALSKSNEFIAQRKFKGLPKKPLIIIILLFVAIGSFVGYKLLSKGSAETAQATGVVTRGDINNTISGSGTIEPVEQYEITSLVKGEIIEAPFEEGQTVNKGDLLYKIDTKDLENNIEKAKLTLQDAQHTYNSNQEDIQNLTVTSAYEGTITNFYVKVGDNVSNNGKIADVIDNKTMVLTIPFISSDADSIYVGARAAVTLGDTYQTVNGTVNHVATGETISPSGIAIKTVEIAVSNPGSIKKGDKATAVVGNVACNDLGEFDFNVEATIEAKTAGKVESLFYKKGDYIQKGSVIAKLSSTAATSSNLKSSITVKNAQLNLQNQFDQLGDYNIKSPIQGTILEKTSKLGDTLDNTNSTKVMAVVADLSKIIFKINIDELDVSKAKENQEVLITADALPNQRFTGYIEKISVVGTTTNGVTTYPITIVVNNPEGLIPGMNVDAEIVVESRQNVLRAPISAVNRGNIVYVKSDESNQNGQGSDISANRSSQKAPFGDGQQGERPNRSEGSQSNNGNTPNQDGNRQRFGGNTSNGNAPNIQKNAPEGFTAVRVETGISDSDYIEILSGLNEGDIVYVPPVVSPSSQSTFMMRSMSGGSMGGGMPGGSMGGTTRSTGGTNSTGTNRSTGGTNNAGGNRSFGGAGH